MGASLTADDIAIGRAAAAVVRLDAMIEAMRRDGTLQGIQCPVQNRPRGGHGTRGGLHGYGVAMARLKRALIPMLQSGTPISGVFEEVFR
jgi:hypothetical protein